MSMSHCPAVDSTLRLQTIQFLQLDQRSVGYILWEKSSSLSLSIKTQYLLYILNCCSSIYCSRFSTVLIFYFSSIKCSNGQKNLSLCCLQRLDLLYSWLVVYILLCLYIATRRTKKRTHPENFSKAKTVLFNHSSLKFQILPS